MPTDDKTKKKSGNVKEGRKPRRTYTDAELMTLQNELRTSGRKGAALPRINLAFAPDTLLYLRVMTRLRNESITQYVDRLLRADMEKNADLYQQATDLIKVALSEGK